MSREKIVEAILEYQTKKRALVKRVTGMDLIPDEVALTAEQLDENGIDRLASGFIKGPHLGEANCLHCVVFDDDCNQCPYHIKIDDCCKDSNSLFHRINEKWEMVENEEAGDKLEDLGDTLEDILYLH